MEEIGEKLNGNSQIQNKTEFQNLPKIPNFQKLICTNMLSFGQNFKNKSCRSSFNRQVCY